MRFVFDDGDFSKTDGSLFGRAAFSDRFSQPSGRFNLVGQGSEVGGRVNPPCTVGEHSQRQAQFLAGNGSFQDAVSHGDRRFSKSHNTNFGVTCPVCLC